MLQLLAGASGGALLHACDWDGDGRTQDAAQRALSQRTLSQRTLSMTLGCIPWIGQVPMYVAQHQGFYAEAGLDFELRLFGASTEYIAAFLNDQLNAIAPITSEAIAIRAGGGKDFKIVMVQSNSAGNDGILARDSIATIEDFKGKKVAVETNAISYFFLLQVLKSAGLSAGDITAINTEPFAAAAAFQSGNIDIAVTYAPFLQEAAEATADGRILYDSSQMPMAISDLYVFDAAYVTEHADAVQAFVSGTLRGVEYLKENPDAGIKIGAIALGMQPDELESDLAGLKTPNRAENLGMLAQPKSNLYLGKHITELASFLRSEGQVETDLKNLETLIDPQFIKAAI